MHRKRYHRLSQGTAICLAVILAVPPAAAQNGSVVTTPTVPMELPLEVEIEVSPAGSLKQAPLWPEIYRLLTNPRSISCTNPADPSTCTSGIERRPGFGVAMPRLNVWPLNYNFLTGQLMRLRTSDGEVSWDQPGPLFDPAQNVAPDAFSTPTILRTPIGHIVACPNVDNPATPTLDERYQAARVPATFCVGKPAGSLVVFSTGSSLIPPSGTVVAVRAVADGPNGVLQELAGESTTATVPIEDLEIPINEEDFFRPATDVTGIPDGPLRAIIGRRAAEVLGKALFWDMQVGSDGVQACGSCHFHGGIDNRTKGQLNSNTSRELSAGGPDFTLQVKGPNADVVASDFPFHQAGQDTRSTPNDVMSSMGVSRFKQFVDIPPISGMDIPGTEAIEGSFGLPSPIGGVRPLAPDQGNLISDPILVNQGLRRVEPRNTPTFHGAAFNLDNFWDGRARFAYNGGSVFGPSDPIRHIWINPSLNPTNGDLRPANNLDIRPDLFGEPSANQPVRIKFSSLASQAMGPPLSDFEMSFAGRNWPKIGKKFLQGDNGAIQNIGNGAPQQPGTNRENSVVPLANQLVHISDSRLGPFSNQGGSVCTALGRPTAVGKPGLCISYPDLIRLAFARQFWNRGNRHIAGAPCPTDPFDGYCLSTTDVAGAAPLNNTNRFRQMEANFSLFFGLSVQAYEELTIPDHTPADQFFDINPNAGQGVGEPGDQAVLFPTLIPDLLDDGQLNGTNAGAVRLVPDNPATPWYDGFGPDEVFGFDIFAGANLTAGLRPGESIDPRSGRDRNPLIRNSLGQSIRVGSNPFTRSVKCMLCHLGPEQTDHSINISHGLLKNDAEFEYPTPPVVPDPTRPCTLPTCLLPAPEPSGGSRAVTGLILSEEVTEGAAQDAVEVEPRDFATFDDPATPWDDRIVAQESNFAFGDQGVYNVGVRPTAEDIGRGGQDPFGWPFSLAALTLKNIGGPAFEPCDGPTGPPCVMTNFDPSNIDLTFEETGDEVPYPGTTHTLQSVNPGFERDPITPRLPAYMVPWMHGLPAGELHPQIDEMAGMVPNTVTPPNGGPGIEFPEIMFGADFHCARYEPAIFGFGPPNFGWGPPTSNDRVCPQHQSGVAGNFAFPSQGTYPVPNRVLRNGAFKAPALRNVELSGPYFHTGSYLTLRQVVDFYFRGGDFPRTNRDNRDPHVVNLEMQAFALGPTQGGNLLTPFDCSPRPPNAPEFPVVPGGCGSFNYLTGSFGDGLPDTLFLYDQYPDSNHPVTPEPAFASRADALEDAKNALVKFMIALTDPRVKAERAPFDRPEIFVPIDGRAPDNTAGQAQLLSQSGVPCPVTIPGPNPGPECFRRLTAVGAGGRPLVFDLDNPHNTGPLKNFLGIASIPVPGRSNDHFDPNP